MPTLSPAARDAWSPSRTCLPRFAAIWAEDSPPRIQPIPIKPLDELLTEVERRSIETVLRLARGNKSRAAELLGISRPRLYRRIKELNLPDDAEPPDETEAFRLTSFTSFLGSSILFVQGKHRIQIEL